MNRTQIEWTDMTWNPLTGCKNRCPYCYARRMAYRQKGRNGYPSDDPFKPTFHPKRLHEPSNLQKPSKIFTCSMGDLFGEGSRYGWIGLIFAEMKRNPRHTFQVLTKRAEVLHQFQFPENLWVGISQDGRYTSAEAISHLARINATVKFISFEPLLGEFYPILDAIDWVIIGAQTGPGAVQPEKEWVESIIYLARDDDIPIFLKDNLNWPEKIQEWPVVEEVF